MNSIFNNFLKLIKASKFKKYFDKPPPQKKSSRLEALLKPITKLYNIRWGLRYKPGADLG